MKRTKSTINIKNKNTKEWGKEEGLWSVLLVGETGVPGENHRPSTSNWHTLSHNYIYGVYLAMRMIGKWEPGGNI